MEAITGVGNHVVYDTRARRTAEPRLLIDNGKVGVHCGLSHGPISGVIIGRVIGTNATGFAKPGETLTRSGKPDKKTKDALGAALLSNWR